MFSITDFLLTSKFSSTWPTHMQGDAGRFQAVSQGDENEDFQKSVRTPI